MKRKRLIKRVAAIVCILAVLFVIPVSAAGAKTFTILGDAATLDSVYYTELNGTRFYLSPNWSVISVVDKDQAGTPHDMRYLSFTPLISSSYFCIEYDVDLTVEPGEMFTLIFPVNVMADSFFADVPDFSLSVYDEDLNGYTLTSSVSGVKLYTFLPAADYMNVAQGEVSFSFRNDTSSTLTRATFNLVCHDLYMLDGHNEKAIMFGFYDDIKIAVEGGSVDVDGIKDSIDELGDKLGEDLDDLAADIDASVKDAIGDDSEFQGDSDRYNDKTDKGDEQNKDLADQDAQKEEILNNAVADASAALENYNFFDLNRMIDGMSGLTASFNVVSIGFSSLLASLGTDFGSFLMYIIAGGVLLALLGEIASASIRGVRAGRQAKERERAKNKKE